MPDRKGTVGVGSKRFGVAGQKLLEPDQDATTHDFIFQDHDVFFVDTARDLCEFTRQSLHGRADEYFDKHPKTKQTPDAMANDVPSALGSPSWGVLPFRFGAGRDGKHKLEPVEPLPPGEPPDDGDSSQDAVQRAPASSPGRAARLAGELGAARPRVRRSRRRRGLCERRARRRREPPGIRGGRARAAGLASSGGEQGLKRPFAAPASPPRAEARLVLGQRQRCTSYLLRASPLGRRRLSEVEGLGYL
ncbi:MAG TPA: hypothetical protein VFS43_41615 [Polyangiaceae bacterium]|nr:hypothetical protein [Polyangiaceae bacterium]